MISNWRKVLVIVTIITIITTNVSANNSRPPRNNDISNIADALKYLQDLDTYYGDKARVRYGKRAPLLHFLRNFNNEVEMASEKNHPVDVAAVDEPF